MSVLLVVPMAALGLWLVHLAHSWLRPWHRDLPGVVLHVALPFSAAVALVKFGLIGGSPECAQGFGGPCFGLVLVVLEIAATWIAVLVLEVVLIPIRSFRRGRTLSRLPGQVDLSREGVGGSE